MIRRRSPQTVTHDDAGTRICVDSRRQGDVCVVHFLVPAAPATVVRRANTMDWVPETRTLVTGLAVVGGAYVVRRSLDRWAPSTLARVLPAGPSLAPAPLLLVARRPL